MPILLSLEDEFRDYEADKLFQEMTGMNDFVLHRWCEIYHNIAKFDIQNEEWMYSGKVQKLTELLLEYRNNGDRVLVFSQFTMVLDILQAVMDTLEMPFLRLDGATITEERQDLIDKFYNETDIPVFLLTTKAGGTGINLACANKVIIFDSSLNPQDDAQAEKGSRPISSGGVFRSRDETVYCRRRLH